MYDVQGWVGSFRKKIYMWRRNSWVVANLFDSLHIIGHLANSSCYIHQQAYRKRLYSIQMLLFVTLIYIYINKLNIFFTLLWMTVYNVHTVNNKAMRPNNLYLYNPFSSQNLSLCILLHLRRRGGDQFNDRLQVAIPTW
jgi:hypothetical protein